ncbi:hypothetical protein K6119_10760 [Paracrocinitomix mangrovi]|uniref:hypothetical protein n=1 Tax=Paracrocinitomix mangrovi TaxID=2862509 RepID=UPI001C8E3262|nr:hypothetical protein [Paracrocinitomix mangrovi]UKN00213.1 hypothetical protein K6119_10760 [Paracrocinitomix mangrovi]
MNKFLLISMLGTIVSCSTEPTSPEEVLEEYMTLMSEGKCEDAIALTTESIKLTTQQSSDSQCESWEMEIISIDCNTDGNSSLCCYKEIRSSMEMEFGFELLKEEDQWKVAHALKPWPCIKNSEPELGIDSTILKEPNWNLGVQFINEYKNFVDTNTSVNRKIEWLKNSNFVSDNFLNHLQQMTDSANQIDPFIGLDYDPIFVAQDYPDEGFNLKSTDPKTNSMIVQGIDWVDFKIRIRLIENNGEWMVDGAGDVNPRVEN